MNDHDYTTAFVVDQTPEEAFAAINNVRGWWSGDIDGDTDKLGAEFTYHVPDVHWCKMRIAKLVPGKEVAWHVLESDLRYTDAKTEWDDTTISFVISKKDGKTQVQFTHLGLVPADECYDSCSNAWGTLVNGNLRRLIITGELQPSPFA
jgi:Activator of Hsp90 ATPase homolog 1-like protein